MLEQINSDLTQVKELLESRTKFISLSGLSGVLAGLFALTGALLAHRIIYTSKDIIYYDVLKMEFSNGLVQLILLALGVFFITLLSAYLLSRRKAKKEGLVLWNKAAKRLFIAFAVPLLVGGIFVLFLVIRHQITLLAPSCLIFYGLALVNASHYTYRDVQYLGFAQIILGLINMAFIGYGLYFWAIGFGVFHILYGIFMYLKYEK